jgi:hypothetical protein
MRLIAFVAAVFAASTPIAAQEWKSRLRLHGRIPGHIAEALHL